MHIKIIIYTDTMYILNYIFIMYNYNFKLPKIITNRMRYNIMIILLKCELILTNNLQLTIIILTNNSISFDYILTFVYCLSRYLRPIWAKLYVCVSYSTISVGIGILWKNTTKPNRNKQISTRENDVLDISDKILCIVILVALIMNHSRPSTKI